MSSMQIVLASYGESPTEPSWWRGFLAVATSVAAALRVKYTHLELSSQGTNALPTTKTYRYSDRAVEKLSLLFDERKAMNAAAIAAGPDGNRNIGATLDLGFSAPNALHPQYRWLLIVDPAILFGNPSRRPEEIVCWSLHELGSVVPPKYALVHLMPRESGPGFYFSELRTPKLTGEERANLDRWIQLQSQYREKIRDVYWGNLLSERHGGAKREALFRAVKEEVGEENLLRMGNQRILFFLPFDIRDEASYEVKLAMWRRRLKGALTPYDVLI